ncbi:MAG: bile acid:sodium symporter family protein [Cytophagales bacterium]|nr:bile acid:sodium symporter family protein [Cytophagales bacterium]
MESSIITDVFLPAALAIIMLGMGLALVMDDFKRVVLYPKAVALGLTNQLILLPLIGFLFAWLFPLKPELAVGIMILAASPGGVTSNLISHVSKGDTALSITLTAISSLFTIITIPFIINFALDYFMTGGEVIKLDVPKTILTILLITVVPVSIGMLIRHFAPGFAEKMNKPVKIMSVVFLALIIAGLLLKEKENVVYYFKQVGLVVLALNVTTMLAGFYTAKLFKLNLPQSITISIESGIQNGTLAIFIALSILHNSQMSITPAIYSLIMFVTGGFMMFYFGLRAHGSRQ